jgi:branched-chain amino acid aminotransferase
MHWYDGALYPDSKLPFDVADRGLTLGDGVFDTSLVLAGTMVWRDAHLRRLRESCTSLGFAIDVAAVEAAVDTLIAAQSDGALRITVTRGAGPRGLGPPPQPRPTILATMAPLRAKSFFVPLSLHVAAIRRNETSPTARLKTLNYLDAVFASQAARQAGFDDALFLNTTGHVACATVGNIVALHGIRLLTPPLADGVLAGTVRGMVLELCGSIGLDPVEQSLTLDDLAAADAVFVTNSLKLLAPVTRIGDVTKPVSTDLRCAALRAALSTMVAKECGVDPRTR